MVGGQLVLASSTGEVIAVDPETGRTTNTQRVGGPVFIPPIAADGLIYVVTDDARLIALR
jgi:outer membrane protein assembly factor BamB